jgi:hypothetical protein
MGRRMLSAVWRVRYSSCRSHHGQRWEGSDHWGKTSYTGTSCSKFLLISQFHISHSHVGKWCNQDTGAVLFYVGGGYTILCVSVCLIFRFWDAFILKYTIMFCNCWSYCTYVLLDKSNWQAKFQYSLILGLATRGPNTKNCITPQLMANVRQ